MKPPRLALRPLQNTLLGNNVCVWCYTRQFLDRPTRRSAAGKPTKAPSTRRREWTNRWANRRRVDLPPRDDEAEQQAQLFAQMMKDRLGSASDQGMISIPAREAEILIHDYQTCTLETLREQYDYPLEAYSPLARLLLTIPERLMNHTGRRMILECSEAKDPLATLTILGCVRAREKWALDIPKIDIASARRHLQTLAYEDQNPDAMILVGLDLRAKRNDAAARVLFEKAMRKVSEGEMLDVNSGTTGDKLPFKVDNVRGHDLLPIPAPWIALGNLLLEQAEPDLEAAKAVFYTGATKADDPLAYFYLAECGDMYSDEWLEYMTKAASSGHPDAMFHMGNFYAQSKQEATQSVGLTGHRHLKAIDSFKSWKSGPGLTARLPGLPDDLPLSGREAMAFEWYFLGFVDAHRSATLGLARLLRRKSAWWAAVEVLKEILEDRDKDEENTVAKREALELTKVWQDEEKKEGLTFTKDVLAAVDSKKR